jgi:hypothetical protein
MAARSATRVVDLFDMAIEAIRTIAVSRCGSARRYTVFESALAEPDAQAERRQPGKTSHRFFLQRR